MNNESWQFESLDLKRARLNPAAAKRTQLILWIRSTTGQWKTRTNLWHGRANKDHHAVILIREKVWLTALCFYTTYMINYINISFKWKVLTFHKWVGVLIPDYKWIVCVFVCSGASVPHMNIHVQVKYSPMCVNQWITHTTMGYQSLKKTKQTNKQTSKSVIKL